MSKLYFKNKDGRIFPATQHLIKNKLKLGLIECGIDEVKKYEAAQTKGQQPDHLLQNENEQLKARIAELEAQQSQKTGNPDVDFVDTETLKDQENDPELGNLTPQQKAALTRKKNQEAKKD